MSTIVFNIVVIISIILVGSYIVFVIGCLMFPPKKDDKDKNSIEDEIKSLERRQRAIYKRLLALDGQKEEQVKLIAVKEVKEEEQPKEEPTLQEEEEEVLEEEEEDAPVFVSGSASTEKKKLPSRRRSFALKLASSTEATKKYFSQVTNRLRYYGLTARIGKSKVMFRQNKEVYAKMVFKGKRIVLCLPLNPKSDKFDPEVYKQMDFSDKKGFEELAFAVKMTNKKSIDLILGLIDEVAKKHDLQGNPKFKEVDYVEKYPDVYTDFEKKGYGYMVKTEVLREEVEIYDDLFAEKILIEEKSADKEPKRLIKAEISIDEFDRYTDAEAPIDLDRLKASDLVPKNANYLIIRAGQRIDKPFAVYANEFEADAVKMICIAGGKAVKITYQPNEE